MHINDILTHRRVQVFRERFRSKHAEGDECWVWTAQVNPQGYGIIRFAGRNHMAHRVAYVLHIGPIPPGNSWDGVGGFTSTLVCHSCDNPSCVNPKHLFIGSTQDNVTDKMRKERDMCVGARNGNTRLTDEQVLAIRADPRRQVDIAADYDINQQSVSHIKTRKTWAHLKS